MLILREWTSHIKAIPTSTVTVSSSDKDCDSDNNNSDNSESSSDDNIVTAIISGPLLMR